MGKRDRHGVYVPAGSVISIYLHTGRVTQLVSLNREHQEYLIVIKEIEVKDIMMTMNLPVSDYAVDQYVNVFSEIGVYFLLYSGIKRFSLTGRIFCLKNRIRNIA